MRSCRASLGIILGKNTVENESWKAPYEKQVQAVNTLFGFCVADRTRRDCMYRPSVMQAWVTKESLWPSF